MQPDELFQRYQQLRQYVEWTEDDARRVVSVQSLVRPSFELLIDDFYAEVMRHEATRSVIARHHARTEQLKKSLMLWLSDLFSGQYDLEYVTRRWQIGGRHVEIGLDQVYASVALSRLRCGLNRVVLENWNGTTNELHATIVSLNRLIDLEWAIIDDAYQSEFVERLQQAERQHYVAQLRQERDFAEGVIETAHAIVLVLDPHGQISRFNTYLTELSGFTLDEVQGEDWLTVFRPPGDHVLIREMIGRGASASEPQGYNIPILTKDGRKRTISWWSKNLRGSRGEITGILAVGHDITELRTAQKQLVQTERLAAIGQMVTGLAHESRNAFQRCQACLEMLALELEENDEALTLVDRIQRALDHLHHLYEEVRDYAAPINLNLKKCDLTKIWRETWGNLELLRRQKKVDLLECNHDIQLVHEVDQHAMEQVFRNILENAFDACPEPGTIEVECRELQKQDCEVLRITFTDNGPGVDAKTQHRVFEPFFTTKTKGTGLGMAISQRIMAAHGGSITIESGPSGGARVVVSLPRDFSKVIPTRIVSK